MPSSPIAQSFLPSKLAGKNPVPQINTSGFGTPGALPSQQLQTYKTQQLPGLLSGQSSVVGPTSPTEVALAGSNRAKGAVQLSAERRMETIKKSNERNNQLASIAAQRRTQGAGGYRGSAAGVGQAYTPDGRLSASRNSVLSQASSYIGSPYVLGGTTRQGIDCSGLVMMIYNQFGYNLNHSANAQGRTIPGVRTSIDNLRPGDLVAWQDGSHIAIYAGNGEIIEAANERVGTVRRKIWSNAVYGIALRLPGE